MTNTRAAITDTKTKSPRNKNSKMGIRSVLTIAKGIPIFNIILPFFSSEFKLSTGLSKQRKIYHYFLVGARTIRILETGK